MIFLPIGIQRLVPVLHFFFARLFGKEPVFTPLWFNKSVYNWRTSSDKAIKELGYQITPLEEGLAKTVKWLRDRRGA